MTERKKFGEFKQNRFITAVELDNSCGIEDLMKQKKYDGFREKDYHKLCSICEELNQLYYGNEQLKKDIKRCRDWINSDKYDYELTLSFIKNKGYSLKDVLKYEKELKKDD